MVDEAPETGKTKVVQGKPSASGTYKLLLAACLVSLIISTLASYFFYHKWSESVDRGSILLTEKNILFQNYNLLKTSFDNLFNDLSVMRDENAKAITLQSPDSTKHYLARVYWNPYTRQTFIDVISLPVPDSTMDYRLWASVGGQFTEAGVFTINVEEDIQHMKEVVNADDWAVTLEPKGGGTMPAMDKIFLITRK